MSEVDAGAAAPAVIDTAPPPVGAPPVETAAPTLDETLEKAWNKSQSNGVAQGEGGKFVSNGKAAQAPAETETAVQPPIEAVEPATVIDAPQSWTAEARAHWAKLPPEAQTYIAQRESEAHKAITSYGERVKSYEPLEKVITQYRPDYEKRGLDAARATATLFEAQRALDQSPIDGLVSIGLSYGIDLRPLLAGQQGALPASDPRSGQALQRVDQLEQKFNRQQETLEQQRLAELDATLKEFAKDRPHFKEVEDEMGALIPAIKSRHPGISQQQLLEKAYDAATFANETVRARIQADQRAADEKKRQETETKAQEEAKRKAAEAQKSARVNVRSSSAHPNPKTVDDTLHEIAARLYG